MTTTLSNEEKLSIVNQHLKSLDYAVYGYELDLIQADAVSSPEAAQIASLRVSEANAKRAALILERDSLTTIEQE
jgi:hypothetical protein